MDRIPSKIRGDVRWDITQVQVIHGHPRGGTGVHPATFDQLGARNIHATVHFSRSDLQRRWKWVSHKKYMGRWYM